MDLRDQLSSTLGNSFTIERELGGGGMSRVFVATDVTLDRLVVIKVLPPDFAAGASADRFRREIQVIAKLQHPHVVPLLSAGTADGTLYYMMPFLGGESLRARMAREGPMSIADASKLLREILDALDYAHAHGVIHRDIKPENIIVEAGHAVVMDFGIAKALRESGGLTSAGISVGTPAYMAPEQAVADPDTDHRADLYAVGVIAYEMLAGSPPFAGSAQQLISAHITTPPAPLKQRRSDVPDALADLVMRALEKEPSKRPQSAREMIAALDSAITVTTPGALPAAPMTTRRRLPLVFAATAVALLGGGLAWWKTRPPVVASAQSIAIMPFSVATGDTAAVRLGQNLVTLLSANLDGVGGIRTADAMSVLSHARAKGALLSASAAVDIARKLGARSVLHGTLVPNGNMVRADAALYDVQSPAEPVARVSTTISIDSVGALTDSLTWHLLRAIWSRGTPPTPNVTSITTRSPTALREFLEAERLFARGGFIESADTYKRAIAADSTFWFAYYRYRIARGWMGLALDTSITNKLSKHVAELPERERLLVIAVDSSKTQGDRVRRYAEVTARYPDYAPGWLSLADYLVHHAVRSGQDAAAAVGPWQQVARLMPGETESQSHLAFACIYARDLACARAAFAQYDSLVRADPSPPPTALVQQLSLATALLPPHAGLRDSLVRVARGLAAARSYAFFGAAPFTQIAYAPLLVDRPELSADFDAVADALSETMPAGSPERQADVIRRVESRAMRGDWTGIDSARRGLAASGSFRGLRALALAELQGLALPDRPLGPDAHAYGSRAGASAVDRADAAWIAAIDALVRGDTVRFRSEVVDIARDVSIPARFATRSLRAIALGRAGNRAAAAESLLVIEREHGESLEKSLAAYSGDRVLAAEWLAEAKRFAPADSLLQFTRGYVVTTGLDLAWPVFTMSQLVRSRIAEGMGNTTGAIEYATIFLRTFDRAPPSQSALVDEARERIKRLGGRLDAPEGKALRPPK